MKTIDDFGSRKIPMAIEASIVIWKKRASGDFVKDECPLCRATDDPDCEDCPIMHKTGECNCNNTPYWDYHQCLHVDDTEGAKIYAQEMVGLLKSLL